MQTVHGSWTWQSARISIATNSELDINLEIKQRREKAMRKIQLNKTTKQRDEKTCSAQYNCNKQSEKEQTMDWTLTKTSDWKEKAHLLHETLR